MKVLNKDNLFRVLPKINLLLVVCVIVLTFYLYLTMSRLRQPYVFNMEYLLENGKSMNNQITAAVKKIPVFDERVFRQHPLFNSFPKDKPQEKEMGFKLLGLISVGDKNAAMIRDLRENKDYYCLEGETVGKFKLRQVLRDKVILEREGQILEIRR